MIRPQDHGALVRLTLTQVAHLDIDKGFVRLQIVTLHARLHRGAHPVKQFARVGEHLIGKLIEAGLGTLDTARLEGLHAFAFVELARVVIGAEIEVIVHDQRELHPTMVDAIAIKNAPKGYGNDARESLYRAGKIVLADAHGCKNRVSVGYSSGNPKWQNSKESPG